MTCLRRFCFPRETLTVRPQPPPEGRCKRKRAARIEGPRTLFLIFGKSDCWRSETFSLGDGAIVDPATRLVCVACGSWRLVLRNHQTSYEFEVGMRDSAEKLLGRHFLLHCASLALLSWIRFASPIQIKTCEGCLLMLVTPRCWCTTAVSSRRDTTTARGRTRGRANNGEKTQTQ